MEGQNKSGQTRNLASDGAGVSIQTAHLHPSCTGILSVATQQGRYPEAVGEVDSSALGILEN